MSGFAHPMLLGRSGGVTGNYLGCLCGVLLVCNRMDRKELLVLVGQAVVLVQGVVKFFRITLDHTLINEGGGTVFFWRA